MKTTSYEVHSHAFISGPRNKPAYDKNGKYIGLATVTHSHPGGGIPHTHPDCGPSFYGYRKPKTTARPSGEQLEFIEVTEEKLSFDLVITDSALIHGETPIGDTPLEELGFPAAERMAGGFRLKCNVRDERKKIARRA